MFLKTKIIQFFKKCVSKKHANRSALTKFALTKIWTKILSVGLLTIFCTITSIKAQINNDLYGEQTGDLAGVSSLMLSVSNNDIDGTKFFSRAGGFLINQKNIGGATALHIAARNGNLEIVNILLENGADVNISDNENWTPLMRASIARNSKIVETLLNKDANASFLNSNHESVLIHATLSDCADCLNFIFTKSGLIKAMNTKLLKEQLVEAFIIARNRENKIIQNLLEGYLDRVIKMTPLISNSVATNDVAASSYIPSSESEQNIKYVLTDSNLEKSVPVVVPVTSAVEIILHSKPETSNTAAPTSSPITKFKFISGAPGVVMKSVQPLSNIPQSSAIPASQQTRVNYKFNVGSKKLWAVKRDVGAVKSDKSTVHQPENKSTIILQKEKNIAPIERAIETSPVLDVENGITDGITLELNH